MIVCDDFSQLRQAFPDTPVWVTLGTFDGMHRGHRHLIAQLREQAAKHDGENAKTAVVTFALHPRVLLDAKPPRPITSLPHKLDLLRETGVDAAIVITFTPELAATEPEDFVRQYLVEAMRIDGVVLGYDNRFGRKGRGDFDLLLQESRRYRFHAVAGEPLIEAGQTVSSSRVREALDAGKLQDAASLLGRPFSLRGVVSHGDHRGRKLGFPTANLPIGPELHPPVGVYGVAVRHIPPNGGTTQNPTTDALPHPAFGVANLGYRPTITPGEVTPRLEVHILDFTGNLYGATLDIAFLNHLRGEQRFASIDALTAQIKADEKAFREWLAASEPRT